MKRDDFKSFLHQSGLYSPARHLYQRISPTRRLERAKMRAFYADLVAPGDLCFDVGANVGQTTEALTNCRAKVITVEPNPLCSPVLEWQFGRNPDVTLVKKAVGATPGTATLNFTGTDSTASIRKDWPFANRSSAEVEVTTLDDLIVEFGRPKLCKVDVEGFEAEVFKGLSRAIPIIYFEIHRNELDRAQQVLKHLSKVGDITAANLTGIDDTAWIFDDWMSIDEFSEQLEANLPVHVVNAVLKMAT